MNRLSESTSPYLLQHAGNPVDWYPWGDDARTEALRRRVPIFLSVGYSACHWCHVMAHESFEDPATAAVMNALFVNVKVDREERPDVDALYMDAVMAQTGRGGWPMSVWMTPEGMPIHSGTYFPPAPRHGLPSFLDVCHAVSEAWTNERDKVLDQATRLAAAIQRSLPVAERSIGEGDLMTAFGGVRQAYDHSRGGFGSAPKFPQAPVLGFLLSATGRTWAPKAGEMLATTLDRMAAGGIRDHVGGGFARYSVDGQWEIPHFEKMLYDNAQLATIYLRSWWSGGNDSHRGIAEETLRYMLRDLLLPGGGFAAAEDADSEGEEGLFYTWTHEEFHEVAGDAGPATGDLWGVTDRGNFEGRNHLRMADSLTSVAERHGMDAEDLAEEARAVLDRLFDRRKSRVRPGLDDKVVTAWNGLALRALSEAARALDNREYLDAARANAEFILAEMTDETSGLLRRSWAKGKVGPPGVLSDQAGYALGLLSLYEATGETKWFEAGERLIRLIPGAFLDGSVLRATTADDLIARPQDLSDNPEPSGASLAHEAFVRLGRFTNDTSLFDLADTVARGSGRIVERAPLSAGHLLGTLTADLNGREVAIVGPDSGSLLDTYWSTFRPGSVLAWSSEPTDTPPLLGARGEEGRTLAYVCRSFVCERPVASSQELEGLLHA